jgi:DNA/RNA endonuclease G (NUC1)
MNIQKGHLVPSETYSFDCLNVVATFTFTNAVPQYQAFNTGPWKAFENKVRKSAAECSKKNGNLYLLTGISEVEIPAPGKQAVQKPLTFFPQNIPNDIANIDIPNSMWTAGCCVLQNKKVFGKFAAIGNNKQANNQMHEITVKKLQKILAIGVAGKGAASIKLFPGNVNCA